MTTRTVRTTVALPADLLVAADRAVRAGKARSRSQLLAQALRRELAAQERAAIDAAFAAMGDDVEARDEALSIADEFSHADWEALQVAKADQ